MLQCSQCISVISKVTGFQCHPCPQVLHGVISVSGSTGSRVGTPVISMVTGLQCHPCPHVLHGVISVSGSTGSRVGTPVARAGLPVRQVWRVRQRHPHHHDPPHRGMAWEPVQGHHHQGQLFPVNCCEQVAGEVTNTSNGCRLATETFVCFDVFIV